ncbi:MAG: PLDc_N domain-containing protein [Maricaulaceae bacterium]|nr:PLDc_N domain-containing protein [Maricaulaceae bacterium]
MAAYVAGPVGLLLLVFNVYAVMNIARSRLGAAARFLWAALVLALPFIGFLVWLVIGPRGERVLYRR